MGSCACRTLSSPVPCVVLAGACRSVGRDDRWIAHTRSCCRIKTIMFSSAATCLGVNAISPEWLIYLSARCRKSDTNSYWFFLSAVFLMEKCHAWATSVDGCDSRWESEITRSPTGQGKTQVEGWGLVWWEMRCILWKVLLNLRWKLWWESGWENKISDLLGKRILMFGKENYG